MESYLSAHSVDQTLLPSLAINLLLALLLVAFVIAAVHGVFEVYGLVLI